MRKGQKMNLESLHIFCHSAFICFTILSDQIIYQLEADDIVGMGRQRVVDIIMGFSNPLGVYLLVGGGMV